jgi:hypothetical protein
VSFPVSVIENDPLDELTPKPAAPVAEAPLADASATSAPAGETS